MNVIEVDARGLRCPLPVIRLAEAAKDTPPGTRITVLATDPAARHDIPAWCRMRHHELTELTRVPGATGSALPADQAEPACAAEPADPAYLRFVVVVGPQPPKASGAGIASARPSRAM